MSTVFITLLLSLINHYEEPNSEVGVLPAIMRHPTLDAVIVCDEPVHDFGTIWAGPRLEHSFEIRNNGSETAWVRVSYPGISGTPCIFEVAPDQSAFVRVSLDSAKMRGTFSKRVTLSFVEPPHPISCAQCGSWIGGQRHALECPAVAHHRLDRCVRYGTPE